MRRVPSNFHVSFRTLTTGLKNQPYVYRLLEDIHHQFVLDSGMAPFSIIINNIENIRHLDRLAGCNSGVGCHVGVV